MKRRRHTLVLASILAWTTVCTDDDGVSEESMHHDTPGGRDTGTGTTASGTSTATRGEPSGGSDFGDCEPVSGEPVSETVTLSTGDDKRIVGTLLRPRAGGCGTAVLLVHQYMRDRWQWGDLPQRLAERGHRVLAIDLRGHGDSDEQDGYLPELLTDPDQAPLDARAALEWLQQRDDVDPHRIGMVGTSIGAYLAGVAFLHDWGVSPIVSISPLTDAIRGLARHDGPVVLGDLYCIATDQDSGGAQAHSCHELVQDATGSVEILVVEDSSDHGVEILESRPELASPIVDWLDQLL